MSIESTHQDNNYAAAFRALRSRAHEPAWLSELRQRSFDLFARTGLPTVKDEEWKYTNVAQIGKTSFSPVIELNGGLPIDEQGLAASTYEEARDNRLVFVNGVFRKDLSTTGGLADKLVALDFATALQTPQYEETIRSSLEKQNENGFAALNGALFANALFLRLSPGFVAPSPVHLLFLTAPANGDQPASFPRVLVHAGAGSVATLIESYTATSGRPYLTNARINLVLDDDARITHYKIQRESSDSFHVATTAVELGRKSFYQSTSINLGGKLSRHDIDVRMDHEGAECWVDGLYMIEGEQHTDTHSVIDHRQPHCTSRQLYKGILDGKSRAVFNGKVFVRHGAQQTDAQQTNKNLLLSNEAQVDTKPQLEIFADDVKCTHGAAVGQLEEDQLFYLESRGINPALARNMLTYGFAEEVIERIKIDSIRRELDAAVLNRLHTEFHVEA
jgi:Fe-S cluster assembly protein SufD